MRMACFGTSFIGIERLARVQSPCPMARPACGPKNGFRVRLSSSSGLAATAFKRFSADFFAMRHPTANFSGHHCWYIASVAALLAVAMPPPSWLNPRFSATESESPPPVLEQSTPDCDLIAPSKFPREELSRHLALLGVGRWHSAGCLGQGVKIAILDSGFRGYRSYLGKAHPCSAQGTLVPDRRRSGGEGQPARHPVRRGDPCLGAGRRVVPSELGARRPGSISRCCPLGTGAGARIISCSVIMPSWSDGNGGGMFDDTLDQILGDGTGRTDLLCFASAGNTAQRHWCGRYQAGASGLHEWRQGQAWNPLFPWGTDVVSVELYGPPGARYDLRVADERTGRLLGHTRQGDDSTRSWTVVRFVPRSDAAYAISVKLRSGRPTPFHVSVLGGGLAYSTIAGSVCCPADAPAVIAVGAVADDGQRLEYSSCGPNSSHPKPDLVAPVPFPSLWRARPFAGTSAAAPQAAALAALCWSHHPDWTARHVTDLLRSAARDLGPPGPDFETGYGLISMPAFR